MAFDLLSGKQSPRDWSCGASSTPPVVGPPKHPSGMGLLAKIAIGLVTGGAVVYAGKKLWEGPMNRGYKVHRDRAPTMFMSRSPGGRLVTHSSPQSFFR